MIVTLKPIADLQLLKWNEPVDSEFNVQRGPFGAETESAGARYELVLVKPVSVSAVAVSNDGPEFVAEAFLNDGSLGAFHLPRGISIIPVAVPVLAVKVALVPTQPGLRLTVAGLVALTPSVPFEARVVDEIFEKEARIDLDYTVALGADVDKNVIKERERVRGIETTHVVLSLMAQFAVVLERAKSGLEGIHARELGRDIGEMLAGMELPAVEPDAVLEMLDGPLAVHSFVLYSRCTLFRPHQRVPLRRDDFLPALFYLYTGIVRPLLGQQMALMADVEKLVKEKDAGVGPLEELIKAVEDLNPRLPSFFYPPYALLAGAALGSTALVDFCSDFLFFNSELLLKRPHLQTAVDGFTARRFAYSLCDEIDDIVRERLHLLMPKKTLRELIRVKKMNIEDQPAEIYPPEYVAERPDAPPLCARLVPTHDSRRVLLRNCVTFPNVKKRCIGAIKKIHRRENAIAALTCDFDGVLVDAIPASCLLFFPKGVSDEEILAYEG